MQLHNQGLAELVVESDGEHCLSFMKKRLVELGLTQGKFSNEALVMLVIAHTKTQAIIMGIKALENMCKDSMMRKVWEAVSKFDHGKVSKETFQKLLEELYTPELLEG